MKTIFALLVFVFGLVGCSSKPLPTKMTHNLPVWEVEYNLPQEPPTHNLDSPEIQALLMLKKLQQFPDIDKPEKVAEFLHAPLEKEYEEKKCDETNSSFSVKKIKARQNGIIYTYYTYSFCSLIEGKFTKRTDSSHAIDISNPYVKDICITGPDIMSVFPKLISNKDMIDVFNIRYDEDEATLYSPKENSSTIQTIAYPGAIHPKPSIRNSKNCFTIHLESIQ